MDAADKKWVRGSMAANTLYLNAGWDLRMAKARFGVEGIAKGSLDSAAVLQSFIKRNPEMAEGFAERAGIDIDAWHAALGADHPSEPEPEPRVLRPGATDEDRELFEMGRKMEEERKAKGEPAPFSRPLRIASRTARDWARSQGQETFTLGQLVAALLRTESIAASETARVANPALLEAALEWLSGQPDPADAKLAAADRGNMKEMMERIWPSVREQSRQQLAESPGYVARQEAKDKSYDEHPELYEQPLNVFERLAIEVAPERQFSQRAGTWMRAAANEARIRKAPETKLDHLFYALLQDGTDTAAYLDARGVDRVAWRKAVDSQLPRYDEGPRWPPDSRDLCFSIPDGKERIIKKELPDDIDISKLTPEERAEYIEIKPGAVAFTDLMWLLGSTREEKTIGFALLREAGITEDLVRAELKGRETGDPDWYKVRPNLVDGLRNPRRGTLGLGQGQSEAVQKAAQFEARLRWAPKVEFEHVLLALLVDGTDTSDLLDALSIDRIAVASEIDAMLPRFESGPYFPEVGHELRLIDMTLGIRDKSSDLKIIEGTLEWQSLAKDSILPPGLALLVARGLTLEKVQERLKELGVETYRSWRRG